MARSVSQLKEEARRAEKREDWPRAIELYREALRLTEESGEISLDLSLYNRIGDLYRRGGDTDEAVRFYRKAVHQYAEEGLHTGAVALCNKILRLAPDQVDTYRVLGRLHATSGLAAEARNAFEEYAGRMEERGDRAAAQDARLELARLVEDDELLVEVLSRMASTGRETEARAALAVAWRERQEAQGEPDFRVRELAEEMEVADGQVPELDAGAGEDAGDRAAEEGPAEGEAPLAAGGATPTDATEGTEQAADSGGAGEAAPDAGAGDEEDVEGVELSDILLHDPSGSPAGPEDEGGVASGAGEAGDTEEPDSGVPAPETAGDGAAAESRDAERVDLGERIRRRLGASPRRSPVRELPDPGDVDDILVGFRAEAVETSGEADPAAHVELGVALRQMGLLEDAIREFQVAARAPDPPLRAFELLGESFLEQDLHGVAVRVLNRALRLPGCAEHELLGVLYQLGVAHQTMDEPAEALDCFERVFSVDIDFRDVAERMETVRSEV